MKSSRRAFFGAAVGAAAVAATWPAWLRRALAQDEPAAPDALAVLSSQYRRAQRAGKPLLVLVVPSDHRAFVRGQAFGELINHGGPEVIGELALTEIAVARLETVRALVPQLPAAAPGREPLMVLIETDAVPARVVPLHGELAASPEMFGRGDWNANLAASERAIDARIALLAGLVHRAVAPDAATIARRAAQARARLDGATRARVEREIAAGRASADTVARAPASIAEAMLASRGQRRAVFAGQLASLGERRVRRARVAGSRWAHATGCGTYVEENVGDRPPAAPCGMGHVAPRSARFLQYYAR